MSLQRFYKVFSHCLENCEAVQGAPERERNGVHLQLLDQDIDTGNATGRLLINMLGTIAQLEAKIRAGAPDGCYSQTARERCVRFARSTSLIDKQTAELQQTRENCGGC